MRVSWKFPDENFEPGKLLFETDFCCCWMIWYHYKNLPCTSHNHLFSSLITQLFPLMPNWTAMNDTDHLSISVDYNWLKSSEHGILVLIIHPLVTKKIRVFINVARISQFVCFSFYKRSILKEIDGCWYVRGKCNALLRLDGCTQVGHKKNSELCHLYQNLNVLGYWKVKWRLCQLCRRISGC